MEVQKFIIVFLGPPGSGKGTQAARLSKELNIPHISTGELFRENIRQGTRLGLQSKEMIDKGLFPPDELVLEMLMDRISRSDCREGFILDGVPRTTNQAEKLEEKFKNKFHLIVINLDVSDQIILKRLTGRLMCKQCGHVYHKDLSPPKIPNICDHCGGELYQRTDDKENVIKERLRVYNEKTAPVLNFYAYRGLKNIDGARDPDIIFHDLLGLIINLMEEINDKI
jgi:adenylate kinase